MKIKGIALYGGRTVGNGKSKVYYPKKEVANCKISAKKLTVNFNDSDPFGDITSVKFDGENLTFEADIYEEKKPFVRFMQALRVAMVPAVKLDYDEKSQYQRAKALELVSISFVAHPIKGYERNMFEVVTDKNVQD